LQNDQDYETNTGDWLQPSLAFIKAKKGAASTIKCKPAKQNRLMMARILNSRRKGRKQSL
jgi:hypothetical protein